MPGCVLRLVCGALCILGTGALPWLKQSNYWSAPDQLERPFYIDCVSSSDCHKDQCCTIGHERFSLPRCNLHVKLGQECSPGAAGHHINLTYPDGATVGFSGVFFQFCPCAFGSYCHPVTRRCVSDDFVHLDNLLDPRLYSVDSD